MRSICNQDVLFISYFSDSAKIEINTHYKSLKTSLNTTVWLKCLAQKDLLSKLQSCKLHLFALDKTLTPKFLHRFRPFFLSLCSPPHNGEILSVLSQLIFPLARNVQEPAAWPMGSFTTNQNIDWWKTGEWPIGNFKGFVEQKLAEVESWLEL